MIARKGEPATDQQLLQLGIFLLSPITVRGENLFFFQTSPQLQFRFPPHLYGKGQGREADLPQEYFVSNGMQAKEHCSRVLGLCCVRSLCSIGSALGLQVLGWLFLRIIMVVFKRGYYKYLD